MINLILNYIKINKNISTSGQPSIEEFESIAKNDFEVVINLAMHNSDNALKNEDEIVSKNNMIYVHIPVSWENPEIDRLKLFVEILKNLQDQNKKVWIHCAKNYRVSVFMHKYKQFVLDEKEIDFIAPKDFTPNTTWKNILNLKGYR